MISANLASRQLEFQMPNQVLFPHARPIDGDGILLCEGDVVGYETAFLKRWADSADLNGRFVKVLACGTAEALYGMADAIGRTMPVIVVEDRDFRSVDEANQECAKKLANREGRNVAMRAWRPWRRSEIENYFVDDPIIAPVFARVFSCSEDAVREAVKSAIGHVAVGQAMEYAIYRARKSWLSTDANRALRVECERWENGVVKPLDASEVRAKLEGRLEKWTQKVHDGSSWQDPFDGDRLLVDFDQKCAEWSTLAYEDGLWRRDWGCKEVLKHVRMQFCAKSGGWWSAKIAIGKPVDWGAFKNKSARDEHDRFVERTIQPELISALLHRVSSDPTIELGVELEELASVIREL